MSDLVTNTEIRRYARRFADQFKWWWDRVLKDPESKLSEHAAHEAPKHYPDEMLKLLDKFQEQEQWRSAEPLSDAEVDAACARAMSVTPELVRHTFRRSGYMGQLVGTVPPDPMPVSALHYEREEDAEFLLHGPDDVIRLVAELRRLKARS